MASLSLESMYTNEPAEAQHLLNNFWTMVTDDIKNSQPNDFKTQELPLARIKKIMKLDEDVKMISAEAPVLFAKAAEIFITELTLRAWIHAEDNKRRTLQRNDIAMAISKYDQFDFLIDIVPREEIRPPTKREEGSSRPGMPTDQLQYFLQVPQQTVLTAPPVIQQPVQLSDIIAPQVTQTAAPVMAAATTTQQVQQPVSSQTTTQTPPQSQQQQQQQPTLQVYTQVVGANGEMQQIPIQLTPSQMQAISVQMQGKQPGQSIVIQTNPVDQQQQQQSLPAASHDADVSSAAASEFSPQPLFQLPMYNVSGHQQEAEQTTAHGELDDAQTD